MPWTLFLLSLLANHHLVVLEASFAYQKCLPEAAEPPLDAQAIITGLFEIRSTENNNLDADTLAVLAKNGHNQSPAVIFTDPLHDEQVAIDTETYNNNQNNPICGPVSAQGIQTLEAANWLVNLLNSQSGTVFGDLITDSFVPGVKIGLKTLDTCGNDELTTTNMANSFVNMYSDSAACTTNKSIINLGLLQANLPKSIKMTTDLHIPVTLYGVNDVDKPKTENTVKLSPSNALIAKTMVKTAVKFAWDQAAIVYSNDAYGLQGKDLLLREANEQKLCISNVQGIDMDSNNLDVIAKRLEQNLPSSPAVLVFARKNQAIKLLKQYSGRQNGSRNRSGQTELTWIFADTFLRNTSPFEGLTIDTVRGLFIVGQESASRLSEFDIHWTSLRPPIETPDSDTLSKWRRHFYQKHIGCRFENERSAEFSDLSVCQDEATISMGLPVANPTLVAVLDSIYAYALTLREAWNRKCAGARGMCPMLANIEQNELLSILKSQDFVHGKDMRSPPSLYGRRVNLRHPINIASVHELLQDGSGVKYSKIFAYSSKDDTFMAANPPIFYLTNIVGQTVQTATPPASICLGQCDQCTPSTETLSYILDPGDVTIAGVFPIHDPSINPYLCGAIRAQADNSSNYGSYQLAEAFWYALENVNSDLGPFQKILNGIKLGGLAIDSCLSPPRASHMITSLINQEEQFTSGERTGETKFALAPNDIIGFIGDAYDNTTIQMASLLRFSGIPQVSYGAEAGELSDQSRYAHFLTTSISDTTRLKLLFQILEELNWDYVQLVYSVSNYGLNMKRDLTQAAHNFGVCVAQSLMVNSNNPSSISVTATSLIRKAKDGARLVILLTEKAEMKLLLSEMVNKTNSETKDLVFLAPKFWGRNSDVTDGAEGAALDSIVFDVVDAINGAFTQFLISKKVGKRKQMNHWFQEYVQQTFQCQFEGKNSVNATLCNPNAMLGQVAGFQMDRHANDVINSVYAYAFGLHNLLKDVCHQNYNGLCHAYRSLSTQERNSQLYSAIKGIKFRDEADKNFGFTSSRDGLRSMRVYAYRARAQGAAPQYMQAGIYPSVTNDISVLNPSMRRYYKTKLSTCVDITKCSKCLGLLGRTNSTFAKRFSLPRRKEEASTSKRTTMQSLWTSTQPTIIKEADEHSGAYKKAFLHREGDILLGGLFPIHENVPNQPFKCGNLSEDGILMLESFLWAIETINRNTQVLRGIKMGAFALDSCCSSGETYVALKQLFSGSGFVTKDTNKVNADRIFGFVNAPNNEPAVTAANILGKFSITNVGPDSPTDFLSDSRNLPYTLRASVASKVQINAMVSLLERLNWTYVSVIYSKGMEGRAQWLLFKSLAAEKGICISLSETIPGDEDHSSASGITVAKTYMEQLVLKLKAKSEGGAKAVVLLFSKPKEVHFLLETIKKFEKQRVLEANQLKFLSSVGWGNSVKAINGVGSAALGALTLEYDSQPLGPLYDYLQGLKYTRDTANPWWTQYWMQKYDCKNDAQCSRISKQPLKLKVPSVAANIINSVWALAVGFSNLQHQLCGVQGGFCKAMRDEINLRQLILHEVRNVAFTRADDPNKTFRFTPEGWADAGLHVLNLVRSSKTDLETVSYRKVGYFANDTLQMNIIPVGYSRNYQEPLKSVNSKCISEYICPECASLYKPSPITTKAIETSATSPTTTSTMPTTTTTTRSTPVPTFSSTFSGKEQSKGSFFQDPFYYDASPVGVDQLTVTAVLPIHQSGALPLSCGHIRHDVYQIYEAIRWAVEQINRDAKLLPGIHLSPLVLDSCSQPTKAVRDMSNFLSQQIYFPVTTGGPNLDPTNVISVLSSEDSEETLALSRVLSPWHIPLLSPGAEVSLDSLGQLYPTNTLLRTGVSTIVQARAIVEVLEKMNWSSVSLLYSEDLWGANGYQDFKTALREKELCLALVQPVPIAVQNCSVVANQLDRAVSRLKSLSDAGVYGVVLWLNPKTLDCLLEAIMRAFQSGNLMPGSIIWILPSNIPDLPSLLVDKKIAALGMVQVRHQLIHVQQFERYWNFIQPKPDDNTPWRLEFFESIFGCSKEECSQLTLASKPFAENAYLSSVIRAVYSIAYGLESIRLRLCGPGSVGLCSRLKQEGGLPALLLAAMKLSRYPDPLNRSSNKLMGFNQDGFLSDFVEILNLRKNNNGFGFKTVGIYNESDRGAGPHSLKMNLAPEGFENGVQAFLMRDRPSDCRDATVSICQACKSNQNKVSNQILHQSRAPAKEKDNHVEDNKIDHQQSHKSKNVVTDNEEVGTHASSNHHAEMVIHHPDRYTENHPPIPNTHLSLGSHRVLEDVLLVPSNKKFLLGAVFPIHRAIDATGFECGSINLATGFQKLAALLFAIEEINRDPYVLPGIQLGAIILDSCSSEERALANWFEVFAAGGKGAVNDYKVSPADIVSVIGMDLENCKHLGDILNSMKVPHIAVLPTPLSLIDQPFSLGTVPSEDVHIQIFTDISIQMEWSYVSVLYEDSSLYKPTSQYFTSHAQSRGICVAKQVSISPDADIEMMQLSVRQLVVLAGARSVFMFVSDRTMLKFMKALSLERVAEGRFIVVTEFNENWAYDIHFLSALSQFRQGLVTIEVQRHNNTKFVNFLQKMTLEKHDPFPTAWFHEFWQTEHQCHIVNSPVSLKSNYPIRCTGSEQLNSTLLQQSPSVLPTVLAVQAAARGLANYIQNSCPGRLINSLSDCGGSIEDRWRRDYLQQIKKVNFTYAYAANKPAVWVNFDRNGFIEVEYSVRNLMRQHDGNYQYREVGVWKPVQGLDLNTKEVTLLNSHGEMEVPESECPVEPCDQCWNTSVVRAATTPGPSQRFDTVWAVIIAALAALGMVVCVICILYFVVTFPINYGTTVCGYMILFGIFCVYALSFAFILNPSEWICGVRRCATGICWALVFAPMLVKVLHTWQMRSIQEDESKILEAGYETTSSPSTLFFTSLAIAAVQAIIAAEWIILVKPSSLTYIAYFGQERLDPGIWRCSPGPDFENGLICSLCYVLVLLAITLIVSLMTWNSDVHNRESRWIFVACLFSGLIWLCWALIATQSSYRLRDPTIAIGLVSNATVILMCLYMRKAYMYQKYRQEAKGGYMDNQSQSLYHPSSALGSYMMNTGSIYSTGKMVVGNGLHAANPLFVQAMPGTQASRINHRQPMLDPNAMIYSNAAYDGGSEFNPGAFSACSTMPRGTASGVMLVDGHRHGEASHRL